MDGGKGGDIWPHLENNPHYFGIAFTLKIIRIILELRSQIQKSAGYYADNRSIKNVQIILLRPVLILQPNNADNICIIEFVKGELESHYFIIHISLWIMVCGSFL